MPDAQQAISGVKCAGWLCVAVGVFSLLCLDILPAICLIIIGCSTACVAGEVSQIKQSLGCAKCCSITTIVITTIYLIIMVVVGLLLCTAFYQGCAGLAELTTGEGGMDCASGRRLSEADTAALSYQVAKGVVRVELGLVEAVQFAGLASFLPHGLRATPQLFRRDTRGREVPLASLLSHAHAAPPKTTALVEGGAAGGAKEHARRQLLSDSLIQVGWKSCHFEELHVYPPGEGVQPLSTCMHKAEEGMNCFTTQPIMSYYDGYCANITELQYGGSAYDFYAGATYRADPTSGLSCARCMGTEEEECVAMTELVGIICNQLITFGAAVAAIGFVVGLLQLIASCCACQKISALQALPDDASKMTGIEQVPVALSAA